MADDERWTPVADFAATYEAEFAAGLLRDAGIPAIVRGAETGIFGPGFAGGGPRGAAVFVPSSLLDEARAVLDEDEDPPEDGEGEAGASPPDA
jgi:hypothetical protein